MTGEEVVSTLAEKFKDFTRRVRVWLVSVKEMVEDAFLVWAVDGVRALLWLMTPLIQLGIVP
eukprot:2375293-Pyramimonas_sp.AAC.1